MISAFIKSLRGSDPDAAVYWLARMLDGGEDPRFIARRMMIFASEDVGNADPLALVVATQAAAAFDRVGLPEGRLILSQAATYLASAPKSNASYLAIKKASPLKPTFAIELANGFRGYLPPPEQFPLGGYTTWPAESSCLEVQAEPKIRAAVLNLLKEVAAQRAGA